MALSSKVAFYFDKHVQLKGETLFANGAVHVGRLDADMMTARIADNKWRAVHLEFHSGRLLVSCECRYYAETGNCMHLWAAILEADRGHGLSNALAVQGLKVADLGLKNGSPLTSRRDYGWLPGPPAPPAPPRIPAWLEHLGAIQKGLALDSAAPEWPHGFEILYAINGTASKTHAAVHLELLFRSRKKNGDWTVPKDLRLNQEEIGFLPDPVDTNLIAALLGGQDYYFARGAVRPDKTLPPHVALTLLPRIAATGRLYFRESFGADPQPLAWDAGEPWKLWLEIRQDDRDQWTIAGSLRRASAEPEANGPERMSLAEPLLLIEGFLVARGRIARFDSAGGFAWVRYLRENPKIPFPDRERDQALVKLLESPSLPPLDVEGPLQFEERRVPPRFGVKIAQRHTAWGEAIFEAELLIDYGRGWSQESSAHGFWFAEERVWVVRDREAEEAAHARLRDLGLGPDRGPGRPRELSAKSMPRVVRELIQAGWHVEADGKSFREPGAARVDVSSGIDWFELRAEVDYGGEAVKLPKLLAALRRGDCMVPLSDGGFGLLPEEWLRRFAPLAGLGTAHSGHLRFRHNQASLLDALLAAQPEVHVDEAFERARQRLRDFAGIQPAPQPEGFSGQLRGYQCEGLGWMEFLRDFGFGGCLADDMGVGKTPQVLALVESRRAAQRGPSLVVAPKSLMFNWCAEAARFTPQLRVLDHTGAARDAALIAGHDLVLTTYGTLVRDAPRLSEVEFDYVVLDEAQAIKNASTASAKAVRLLRGRHRLALSGTPVENHLGELWSLFEFLNPGMLGDAKVLKMTGGLARNPGEEARRILAQALRPFILRRTKQQVARELPEKTEQTIFCELEGAQKRHYEELRNHYRDTLLARIQSDGLNRSKMHVLEALLRLRQAACHPGLLDPARRDEPSSKLEVLLDQLEEIREEGHKALVFSQFTSLLAIVRSRLDAAGVRYEYLDGQTRDRKARVDTFQNDDSCTLFLVSLKAGGLGLNLTAAEYVFLLDPWWNPAVEAQAVDRTHRIGQTKPVFAYRLIARDTVEEKVLELQQSKRDLADAILTADNSLIRDLKREDIELLLS